MSSVLQQWIQDLPFMQQTTLLTAIRGPDGVAKYDPPKMLLRWYRRCILISALDGVVLDNPVDPRGGSFTGPSIKGDFLNGWADQAMNEVVSEYIRNLDAVPAHYQHHFMHSIEILGYKHPTPHVRKFWLNAYLRLVAELNLNPETEEQMDNRLGDNREQWLSTSDEATRS